MNGPGMVLTIGADHPAYAGHFPGQPILPGVVLLDEALHALAAQQGVPVPAGQIKSAKFHRPVLPGEALTLRATAAPGGGVHFEIHRSDACVVASGTVIFMPAVRA